MAAAITRMRRITQWISLILLNSSWGPDAKWLCAPVLNCHSCVLAWFACPIGVIVHYSAWQMFPFFAVGTVLLLGIVFGRVLCGWVCPFGLIQDLLHKIPSPKFVLPDWMRFIKYGVLLVMVILIPFFMSEEALLSFCRYCPISAVEISIPNWVKAGFHVVNAGVGVKLAVLAVILVLAVLSNRSFCKVLCPIGALLAPLNWFSFWIVKRPAGECPSCGACDKVCPTQCRPSVRIKAGVDPSRTPECILCYECQPACANDKQA